MKIVELYVVQKDDGTRGGLAHDTREAAERELPLVEAAVLAEAERVAAREAEEETWGRLAEFRKAERIAAIDPADGPAEADAAAGADEQA